MPCQVYEPYEEEIYRKEHEAKENARKQQWYSVADELTHVLDESRERLLADLPLLPGVEQFIIESVEKIEEISTRNQMKILKMKETERLVKESQDVLHANKQVIQKNKMLKTVGKRIEKAQIQHRKEDIVRVIHFYADRFDFEEVARVAKVDVSKPIINQLGYDPDDLD